MNKYLLLFFVCCTSVWLFSLEINQDNSEDKFNDVFPSSELTQVETGLSDFIAKIPLNDISIYGFKDKSELNLLTLGKPFRLYILNPDRVIDYKNGNAITNLLEKTKVWYFPVTLDDLIKAFLVVETSGGKEYIPVSFGYIPLANQLNHFMAERKLLEVTDTKLVVCYQAKEFFLAQPELEPQKLYQIQYNYLSEQSPDDNLSSNISRIRPLVISNIKAGY